MFKYALVGLLVLAVSGCGGDDESKTVPAPVPPTTEDPGDFDPPETPDLDDRIPDLSKAVPMQLSDGLNGLTEIFNFVVPPLVGDPLVQMEISGGRSSVVTGSILLAFEDAVGFGGAILTSFQQVGIRSSNYIDMIFADDELVVRAFAYLNGDDLTGTVYYRLRQSGENQCKRLICNGPPGYCPTQAQIEATCRSYMNFSNSSVKELGAFEADYSKWVTSE